MAGRGILETRARRSGLEIDMVKFREALAGPEMDTRIWGARVVAAGDAFKVVDEDTQAELWFVSAVIEPYGIGPVNLRLQAVGGIMWCPVKQGDELDIILPEGNPNAAPSCSPRLANLDRPAPAGWNNDAVMLVADQGVPVRIVGPDVSIGAATDATNPAANNKPADAQYLGTTHHNDLGAVLDKLSALATALQTFMDTVLALPPATTLPTVITAANGVIAAANAFGPTPGTEVATQIDTYKAGTHLSGSASVGK